MHYQVVARRRTAGAGWEYYPYWSPVHDGEAAERLAHYAVRGGYEAAIVQGATIELLEQLARRVVECQDSQALPALRYLPGARTAYASGRQEYLVETALTPSLALNPYTGGPERAELDRRRLSLEMGPGGDITRAAEWRPQPVSLSVPIGVLRVWIRLHNTVQGGEIGGAHDGHGADCEV
jgi:hypothetical protein